jgi:hypothetical protein
MAEQPRRLELLPRDWFDITTLLVFAGLSVWLLAFLVSKTGPNHLWTGTDGPYIGDQMQYLGWIQDAGHHVLIGNPFDTKADSGDFLNPLLLVSAVLTRFGFSASASYLVWKPVAVVVFFLATHAYVYRMVRGTSQRRCALVLALFFTSPVASFVLHISAIPPLDRFVLPVASNEMWPILYLWGYPLTAIAIGSMCFCLLCYERDRSLGQIRLVAPVLSLLCAWLQPWQGATIVGTLVLSELVMWSRERKLQIGLLAATAGAAAVPLVYFSALGHFDPVWKAGGVADQSHAPFLSLLIVIAPLAIPALLAYRLPIRHYQSVIVRIWPVVAVLEVEIIDRGGIGTYGLHALQGLSIPLAVLAVIGVASLRIHVPRPLKAVLATALVLFILLPNGWKSLNNARTVGVGPLYGNDPYFITRDEQDALDYLKDTSEPGSVLAPSFIGELVPAETARNTWVGNYTWTPNDSHRAASANALFSGKLSTSQATRLIRSSHARFLLSDCSMNANLSNLKFVLDVKATRYFGCTTVYRVSKA